MTKRTLSGAAGAAGGTEVGGVSLASLGVATFVSEESVTAAEEEVRRFVGVQGIEERWREDKLVVER